MKDTSLKDKIIVSTRPASANGELRRLLSTAGAKLVEFPMITFKPAIPTEKEEAYLAGIMKYTWIIFTSSNGIQFLNDYLKKKSFEISSVCKACKIAVIGNATKQKAESVGLKVHLVSDISTGKDFGNQLRSVVGKNESVLLVQGNLSSNSVRDSLGSVKQPDVVTLYHTVKPDSADVRILDRITDDRYDIILVTSPSGIRNLKEFTHSEYHFTRFRFAAIGNTTAEAIRLAGGRVSLVCQSPYAGTIVKDLDSYFSLTAKSKT